MAWALDERDLDLNPSPAFIIYKLCDFKGVTSVLGLQLFF